MNNELMAYLRLDRAINHKKGMRIKKYFIWLPIVLGLFGFFFSIPTFANETMQIAVHDYIPYYDSQGRGLASELYKAAGKAANININIKVYPVKRALIKLFANEVDAFSPGHAFMNSEQIEKCSHIQNTFTAVVVFFYKDTDKAKQIVYNGPDDLRGKKVGLIVNSPWIPFFKENKLTWEEKQNPDILFKMLNANRFDLVEAPLISGLLLTKKLFGNKMTRFNFVLFSPALCGLAFPNSSIRTKKLLPKYLEGFETIKKNGEYMKIVEKYWGKGNVQKEALPLDLMQYGVDKVDIKQFSEYNREPWGKIKK